MYSLSAVMESIIKFVKSTLWLVKAPKSDFCFISSGVSEGYLHESLSQQDLSDIMKVTFVFMSLFLPEIYLKQ